jgi:Protein ENHANCED DISEASE RESISTANCE 2, C-terminal
MTFSCYSCGSSEVVMDSMRPASISRRSDHLPASHVRSRSTEHYRTSEAHLSSRMEDLSIETIHDNEDEEAVSPKHSSKSHRRAMSDPFDNPEELEDVHAKATSANVAALPTLPRYPVCGSRDKNCWGVPPVSIYHVRGVGYLSDKKKVPSGNFLLNTRGCDLFLADPPIELNTK